MKTGTIPFRINLDSEQIKGLDLRNCTKQKNIVNETTVFSHIKFKNQVKWLEILISYFWDFTFWGPTNTKYRMTYISTSRVETVYPVLPCIQELLKAHSYF
jgi:hypothetical protein